MGILASYNQLKAAWPDHLLLLHLGESVFAFGADARTVAGVLHRSPSWRQAEGGSIPQCSFPFTEFENAVEALSAAGHSIALAEYLPGFEPEPEPSQGVLL